MNAKRLVPLLATVVLCLSIGQAQQVLLAQTAAEWDQPVVLFAADSGARVFSPLVVEDTEGNIKILWEVATGTGADAKDLHNGIYYTDGDGVNWSQPIDVIVEPGGGRPFWPQPALDPSGPPLLAGAPYTVLVFVSHWRATFLQS